MTHTVVTSRLTTQKKFCILRNRDHLYANICMCYICCMLTYEMHVTDYNTYVL